MKNKTLVTLALLTASLHAVAAQPSAPEGAAVLATGPGHAVIAKAATVTGKVIAIDHAARTASLKGANGHVLDVEIPPEAGKFDRVKVGDLVTVTYERALSLNLEKSGNGIRESSTQQAAAPTPEGAVAGGARGRQLTVVANVVAVDKRSNVVTLRGPKGNLLDLQVADPAQLELVKKGDQVRATYTEAVAITVARASGAGSSKK